MFSGYLGFNMKVAIVLFCAFVAIQGRNVLPFDEAPNAPWLVHLRVAKSSGEGFLDSCVGGLYNQRWVLTSASCVQGARFVWIRYNAPNVFKPELVTETSRVTIHPAYDAVSGENDIALIDINRDISLSDSIQPIELAASDAEVPSSGKACGYGKNADGGAGEDLFCVNIDLEVSDDLILAGLIEPEASKYDLGAPLVSDNQLYGILVRPGSEEYSGAFLKISSYLDWISEVAGGSARRVIDAEDISVAEPILVAQPVLIQGR